VASPLLKAFLWWEGIWLAHALYERRSLYAQALKAARQEGKPLLVVGTPYGMYGCGDVTLDPKDTGECPNVVTESVEAIPFSDKHFGAVFASHVLEHVCEPEKALAELHRVADHVYIAWPRPWRTIAWVNRGHTWLMTKREGEFQFRPLRDACNAPRFFGEIE
jgi:SAM-dependent methyltransferase